MSSPRSVQIQIQAPHGRRASSGELWTPRGPWLCDPREAASQAGAQPERGVRSSPRSLSVVPSFMEMGRRLPPRGPCWALKEAWGPRARSRSALRKRWPSPVLVGGRSSAPSITRSLCRAPSRNGCWLPERCPVTGRCRHRQCNPVQPVWPAPSWPPQALAGTETCLPPPPPTKSHTWIPALPGPWAPDASAGGGGPPAAEETDRVPGHPPNNPPAKVPLLVHGEPEAPLHTLLPQPGSGALGPRTSKEGQTCERLGPLTDLRSRGGRGWGPFRWGRGTHRAGRTCGTVEVSAALSLCCHSRRDRGVTAEGPRRRGGTGLQGEVTSTLSSQHPQASPAPTPPAPWRPYRAPGSWWPGLWVPLCGPGSSSGPRRLRLIPLLGFGSGLPSALPKPCLCYIR